MPPMTHPFRIGAATTAATAAGFPALLIEAIGQWRGDIYLPKLYPLHCQHTLIHSSTALQD